MSQPPAPTTTEKKVYPKEKHPKAAQSPKFGQRLLVAPPKEKPPVAKPEQEVKPVEQKRTDTKPEVSKPATSVKQLEQKRSDMKPEVAKPVDKVAAPHKKTPEPQVKRVHTKAEKVCMYLFDPLT